MLPVHYFNIGIMSDLIKKLTYGKTDLVAHNVMQQAFSVLGLSNGNGTFCQSLTSNSIPPATI